MSRMCKIVSDVRTIVMVVSDDSFSENMRVSHITIRILLITLTH